MRKFVFAKLFVAAIVLALPVMAEAGRLLICYPFQTADGKLLQWGSGPGWNTPDRAYNVQRLTDDTLALLDAGAPVLTRMENLRRAAIYATSNRDAAEQLLAAVLARADAPNASRLALFDAGYLVETYKHADHLFGRAMTQRDGYSMVMRAINAGGPSPEMEFAAALMTGGATSSAHMRRARTAAAPESLLAQNITNLGY